MFAKRVKYIRDMFQEKSILEKKIERETSKFADNLESEIKKKFRRLNPGIQIKLEKIEPEHFVEKRNRKNPLLVYVTSLNGRMVHVNGFWVAPATEKGRFVYSDADISVEDFEDIINQLSEDLDVNIQISYIDAVVDEF